ncbi:unnamed protein product [Toxocara canis]|uniref:VWFA domain-containing protein n=1 Tax=Toxocara canis TaxID=6265 RepID=A0A183U918_TOXCA|nr:unnamed protein product [Toxocara canis]
MESSDEVSDVVIEKIDTSGTMNNSISDKAGAEAGKNEGQDVVSKKVCFQVSFSLVILCDTSADLLGACEM